MQYFRPRFDFLRGAFVHNMAVVDDVGAIGERECRCQVLLHQQDRLPTAASLRQASTRSRTITGARPSNGSSSRMIFGSRISARAIASICCSPPDRSVPRLHRFGPYCTMPYTGSIGSVVGFVCSSIISMYGGGFSTVPAYLKDMFGTRYVAAIHGMLRTSRN